MNHKKAVHPITQRIPSPTGNIRISANLGQHAYYLLQNEAKRRQRSMSFVLTKLIEENLSL